MPSYGYVRSDWNPTDGASRFWEKRRRSRSSFPRRRKSKARKPDNPKQITRDQDRARQNRKIAKDFDSTLGYPGEGPAPRKYPRTKKEPRRRTKVTTGAERFMTRRTRLERFIARRGFNLRQAAIRPITRKLYVEAFTALWAWAGLPPPTHVASRKAYDALLAEYICLLWEHGATRGEAGNALSGSVAAFPELRGRGKLPESWYMLQCWSRLEVPCRAPPLPALVVLAMCDWLCRRGQTAMAFLLAAGFDCFLRTRELLSLTWADISVDRSGGGVISLAHTKVGQRNAAFEASVILDPVVPGLLRRARAQAVPGTSEDCYIFPGSEARFYLLFGQALEELGLAACGFRPYSLRRGGATAYFRATRNMSATIERGRWATLRVARIYVNDGLAKEVELRLPSEQQARLRRRARSLVLSLQ